MITTAVRDKDKIQHLNRQLAFTQKTGLCPICRTRPTQPWPDGTPRDLCGREACVRVWWGYAGIEYRPTGSKSTNKEIA